MLASDGDLAAAVEHARAAGMKVWRDFIALIIFQVLL